MIVKVLYVLLYLVALWGCWMILSTFIVLPNKKQAKVIKAYSTKETKIKPEANTVDMLLDNFSKRFVKYVSLNDIKRSEMAKALYISHNPKTPEEYMAYIYTVTGVFVILGLILLIFSKVIGAGVLVLAVITYIYNIKKLNANRKKAVGEIEKELPRYVAYLKQSLKTNPNVISVMEHYSSGNEAFMKEMTQAIADAKTSNFDSAMARLDQRVNSDRMKMILHGLISAYHGDDISMYFAMLEKDFTAFEINELKKSIKTIPQRMQIPKILIFTAIALAMFTPLAIQIVESFKAIFAAT